jgi:hypothetical protein
MYSYFYLFIYLLLVEMCLKIKMTYCLQISTSTVALQYLSPLHCFTNVVNDVRKTVKQDWWQFLTPHLLKVILILDHKYDYILRGIPSLSIAGYSVYEYPLLQAPTTPYNSITCWNRPTLLHYTPQPPHITPLLAQTAPHYSITCPNRPTLLHYMPHPPHITPLHAPTAPHYSITCPNRPILHHLITNIC